MQKIRQAFKIGKNIKVQTMPTPNTTPLLTKLHAISLIDSGEASIRYAAKATGIAKSTLFDNIPKFRESANEFTHWQSDSEERLIRNTLSIAMEGKSSARDTAVVLSRIHGKHVDHHKVLDILATASGIAKEENVMRVPLRIVGSDFEQKPPLSHVSCAAFDEIFQRQKPLLSFVEPVSGYCHIAAADDRKGETWETMLRELKLLGLDPSSTITDGGQGMLKGLGSVFPDAANLRDLYHVVAKLGKALRAFEGICYSMIVRFDKSRKCEEDVESLVKLEQKINRAIDIFDALELEFKRFRSACYCDNESGYIGSQELEIIVKRIVALIECADRNGVYHRSLREARTYFKGAVGEIIAYKVLLESQVISTFGPEVGLSVLDSICPMIEYLDQIQRSYENIKRKAYWSEKLAKARAKLRDFELIDQNEVDRVINQVAKIMLCLRKSNSIVEALNSVIRRFLVTYKSIPSWFDSLFTFFWNHRTFSRGKRKGLKPKEILTGRVFEKDWISVILDKWPTKSRVPAQSTQKIEVAV